MNPFTFFSKQQPPTSQAGDDKIGLGYATDDIGVNEIHRQAHRVSQKSLDGESIRKIVEEIEIKLLDDPDEAKHVVEDLNGFNFPPESTALHILIKGGVTGGKDEVRIVKAFLEADPTGVVRTDSFGRTPLFHAVYDKTGLDRKIIEVLLTKGDSYQAILTPCHTDIANCPQYKKFMLRRHNADEMATRRKEHRTPLYMTWDTALNRKSTTRFLLQNSGRVDREGTRMEKATLLLEHVYQHKHESQKTKFLLPHAALYFHEYLPVGILSHIFDHEDYVADILQIEDVTGRTALHVAAVSNVEEDIFLKIIEGYYRASPEHSNNFKFRCTGNPTIPEKLREASRCKDYNGKLPLTTAVENGYCFGQLKKRDCVIDRLLEANPEAISMTDEYSGLYPFMTAATVLSEALIPPKPPGRSLSNLLSWKKTSSTVPTGTEQLTNIYELLRKNPILVKM